MFFNKAKAQQYFFKNYSVESGLPFVQVSCMYQQTNGYLWSGGYGGLCRFDGKNFLIFSPKNGLIDHNVNAIAEDDSGSVFVGTNKGLSVIKNSKIYNYGKKNEFLNPFITSICKGSHNSMYLGTNKGLLIFKENEIKSVKRFNDFKINCLYKNDSSFLFVGTDKGLVIYSHKNFQIINQKSGLPSNEINCISLQKNKLIIGTSKGLSVYDLLSKKITNYFTENGLLDENITSVLNQNNEFVWVGSHSGLLKFDGFQFTYYNIGPDNNSNFVRCLVQDREDNIWIGTHSGLYRYHDNSFSTYDKINGPGNAFVFQIFRDNNGDLWMTSENNGIYKYSGGYFKRYGISDGLMSNTSLSGIQDTKGRLLFGTSENITQFINEKFYTIPLTSELKGSHDIIYLASDNKLWIGGSNGVASLIWKNNKPESKFYPINFKSDFQVYGICEDDDKNIYVGTQHAGLYKVSGDSTINIANKLNWDEDDFFSLRYTNGHLFAASLNGLLDIDLKTNALKHITINNGLNSDYVYSIELTENKTMLWIGTNQGINKLNLKKYLTENTIELKSYGKQEGFAGVECNTNGIWEDGNGTLWFGTVSGIVKHEPFNSKQNKTQNSTLIQTIKIFNEDTLLQNNSVLPYNFNAITFGYRGICLTNPDKVLYQKKLEGLDEEWSLPSNEDYSKYANLTPGKYIFKVKSCNDEGLWDTKETAFYFTIARPFYLTWWFILICIVFFGGSIFTIFKFRVLSIAKNQKIEFNRKVEMSKIELKALRSQMNPHFIFNSLNSIQHYIFNNKSDEAIKYLSKFARLVRIILNNSDKPTVTVEEDLEGLKLYLELEQMRFEGKFDYEIVIDESVDVDYDIMPPMLMQPYVENAILHGLNPNTIKGKLIINLSAENNFLICTITDNGIGRKKSAEIRHTMPISKHKSLGMKITEDRLRILNEINNSKLSVIITDLKEGDISKGTQVKLFIPLIG
ncbi:MAG: two-component regulator propeller domain-containing protein [Bacteroidota bacterium]|nr:two-component regulator propeller domain-containing protein [Bacteroidota bacterium]MDP3144329.1 two-component regulator propeller domain-containing protein [Bacteroidota bacterium]